MIPRGYLSPTCGECGRTFDLLNADDAAEWEYGHDCEDSPRDSVADVLNRHGIAHRQTPRGIVAGNPDNAPNTAA